MIDHFVLRDAPRNCHLSSITAKILLQGIGFGKEIRDATRIC
jgi:hypothetical protein